MSELINNEKELEQWFTSKQLCSKEINKQAYVSAKIRRLVMTSINQNRVTIDGTVKIYVFKSVGGGVYKVTTQAVL